MTERSSKKFQWTDYAYGSVANRNNPSNYLEIYGEACLDDTMTEVEAEGYCGMYQFQESYKSYCEQNGSVSGYIGEQYANFFALDIDGEDEDVATQRERTVALVEYLQDIEIDPEEYYIFFSGNKGFHVLIPQRIIGYEPSETLYKEFSAFAKALSAESGVPVYSPSGAPGGGSGCGIDLSVYDVNRLFRLPNTLNKKSMLYKVQLTFDELLADESYIFSLATKKRGLLYKAADRPISPKLRNMFTTAKIPAKFGQNVIPSSAIRTASDTHIKNGKMCMATLLKGIGEGQRDLVAIRLADHFRKQGYTQDMAHDVLSAWDIRNHPPLGDRAIATKIKSAYSRDMDYGCNDFILSSVCDSRCFLYSKLVKGQDEGGSLVVDDDIMTRDTLIKKYINRYFNESGIKFGIPSLDQHIRGLYGGHVIQYMAKSSGGKTSFAMHIMNNLSKAGVPSLFMSLEMPGPDVGERGYQIATCSTQAALERLIMDMRMAEKEEEDIVKEIIRRMGDAFEKVVTVDEDSSTIERIEQYVHKAKEQYGVKVVFVDYLGRISQLNSSSYEHVSSLARELKTIAKRQDIVVIYLHQVNRMVEDNQKSVSMSDGRDSGQTEESADIVMASWRPDVKNGGDKFKVRILKNRRGPAGVDTILKFIPETMTFEEVENTGFETAV